MPSTLIALIRGINVGKAKRIAMADLRAMIEGLGFSDVRTLLNSGNVVFSSSRGTPSKAAERIEKSLVSDLGVPARVTVLTAAELDETIAGNSLLDKVTDPTRLLVAVLRDPADRSKLQPLSQQDWAKEAFALGKRVAYLWCPDSILDSKVANAVNRALKDGVTARNWATMLKLQALAKANE